MGLLFKVLLWLLCLPFSAKLKAPLLSLGAAGQLGKALVFFGWKGIDCVREYVVPANPKTTDQLTQRALMTAAVAAWHAAPYDALDVVAWNRYAGVLARIMSGFNAMVKEHIVEALLGNTWERLRNGSSSGAGSSNFDVFVQKVGGGNAPTCHYGTRKTHFPDSEALADMGGATWSVGLSGLSADTLYYFYFSVGTSASDYSRTGIYQQRTTV